MSVSGFVQIWSAHPEEVKTGILESGKDAIRIPDIWHYWIVGTSNFEALLDIFLNFSFDVRRDTAPL